MRLFLSIGLNEELYKEMSRLQSAIRSNLSPIDKLTLVRPESTHITVKFFGEVEKEKAVKIVEALRSIKKDRFSIETDKLNYYTMPNGRPRVVFLSFKRSQPLMEFHNAVEECLKPLGFTKSDFKCHATLFRVRYLKDKFRLIEILKHVKVEPVSLEIKSMELFESVMTEKGPIYTLVEKFEMN